MMSISRTKTSVSASNGTVKDYTNVFVRFDLKKMGTCSHLYFGFDRYQEYSIKSGFRSSRSTKSSRQYRLALEILLPP